MASGFQAKIGIGREAVNAWGTAVAPTSFVNASESLTEQRDRIREDSIQGVRGTPASRQGRLGIEGAINGVHARPDIIGEMVRAAIGVPTTTGTAPNFVHTFQDGTVTPVSNSCPLPPMSAMVTRGNLTHQYAGGQLSQLVLKQNGDGALILDSNWLFKSVANATEPVRVLSSQQFFVYRDLAVTRGGQPLNAVEDLTITVANALEGVPTLNQSNEIACIEYGDVTKISLSMTLAFKTETLYTEFVGDTATNWVFKWQQDANTYLKITVPRLVIESWSAPVQGAGRIKINVDAMAEVATSNNVNRSIEVELANTVASYA